jgi:hypothetical protein
MPCICLKCIGDESLREIVKSEATDIQCKYCERNDRGISMEGLAKIVDKFLRDYLRIGSYMYPDEEQEGDSLDWVLQEELEIDYDPAVDLARILEDSEIVDIKHGEDPFYRSEENYLRSGQFSREYHEAWKDFIGRIKHRTRFFDEIARTQLASILGEPGSPKANELPWIEIGPRTKVELLFRARLADSEEKAKKILKKPSLELGPPPAVNATAGRMNPAGISVFYGALSEETAIAEVRPSVGSLVVAGRFISSRKLKLLNLPRINIGFTGSIFHPDYEDRLARFKFFEIFHALIARPIQPREELLEYIPTQAVAEYVSNILGFDGIIYASAQMGVASEDSELIEEELSESELRQHNVVLLGKTPLIFQAGSAHVVKIRSVTYSHEQTFIQNSI